jgi:hypothetical protein
MLQVGDLKVLQTGHYVLYVVRGYGHGYERIPFVSKELADECLSAYKKQI